MTKDHLITAKEGTTLEEAKNILAAHIINEAAPGEGVIKIKALEAFQAAANGKATKIIIPSEMQGLVGLANGIVEGTKE